ncbi:transglycosylase SLT domain-containing protein [Serratia marcescens]|uniref:transglycosylase SLT domain-containing protein n=1 Tax=Serratia marcescens TaxID=615 RepID=UPI0007453584|nr:transglycosylase SLT domain-containing protein [Serratia marcescens]CVB83506.1 Soluble lytic murein transglycosylase precursor [Serratia marcescens]CVC17313.1 Soluble lytic murein transglycosylase precursor [Serratia marcescens]CVC38001.1 Soluble lytic murein transglycosylase precursor [Serratia marcescens]CVC80857.1 Soluble lytic murein transglycosylase precursor [Serratia marcescens]CVD70853.1 Soluble lytic murein transglycosylase precursor [Serratia marcescens]
MPIVPTYQRQSQSQMAPVNTQDLRLPKDNVFTALADVGAKGLDVYQQERQKVDLADMQDKLNQFSVYADDLYNNPQNGLITLQGKNAVGQGEARAGLISDKAASIRESIPEYMRQAFDQQIQPLGRSYGNRFRQYEVGQKQQYEVGQQQGVLSNFLTQAKDPAQFLPVVLSARQAIMDFGATHGQSPEEIEANWQQWYQGAANAAFSTAYTNMYQQTMGPGGIIPVTEGANSDQLFSAMIRAESGGNQFDNNGSPLMSSKGAVGIAQVTEATGPEAAQLAGLSWDRDKWLNDPRYNATIGHAYFQSQMKRYGGDSVLAVAAYNAGHGQVDKWIKQNGDPRTGEISSAEFAAKIPFEETRNYVSKVVGSAPGIPVNASITGLMNTPYWQAMSPQNKSAAMAKVAGLYDLQNSAARVGLQNRMQDDVSRVELGLKVPEPITDREWIASMPLSATPQERLQLQQSYQHYQQTLAMQPAYQTIVQGDVQQGMAAVNAMKPDVSDPDFAFKQQRYAQVASKFAQVQKAREDDPGAWLLQNSPVIKDAYNQFSQRQVTGEFFASRIQAEKERLGIRSKDILPTEMVNSILHQIDNSNEQSVAAVHSIAQSYGSQAPAVIAQLQGKGKSYLSVVTSIENANAATAIFQNRNASTDELKKAAGTQSSSVESEWSDQFADFAVTLTQQRDGIKAYTDFNEQGKRLAYIYASRGMDGAAAAKMAFNQIAGDQYDFEGTWRLPKSLNLNARDITDGASNYLEKMKPEDIDPKIFVGDARLPPNVGRAMALSRIKNNAEWVTSEDESGLYLTANHTYINGADGNPIFVPFNELSKLGIADRSFINARLHELKTPATFTPADGMDNRAINNDLSDVYRSLRGEPAREFTGYQEQKPAENPLGNALQHRSGQ